MKPSIAFQPHRDAIRAIVSENKGANPRVFGSVARGENAETSDLDIVVERVTGMSLFDLAKMHLAIEVLIGVPVDVVTLGSIPDRVVDRVLADSFPV